MILSVIGGIPLHIKRVSCRVVYSMIYFQLNDYLLWSEESKNSRCGLFLPCTALLALIFCRHSLMITDIYLAVTMLHA